MLSKSAWYSKNAIRNALKSRSFSDVMNADEKRKYLETWLGGMSGESYTNRLVKAAALKKAQGQHVNTKDKRGLERVASSSSPSTSSPPSSSFNIVAPLPIEQPTLSYANAKGGAKFNVANSSQLAIPVVTMNDWSSPSVDKLIEMQINSIKSTINVYTLDFTGSEHIGVDHMSRILDHVNRLNGSDKLQMLVQNVPAAFDDVVRAFKYTTLRVVQGHQQIDSSLEATKPGVEAKVKASAGKNKTIIHHGTVRSGQQIYANGGSLVVIGSVNDGAEVLADGDVHIYGQLMGRAVAGLDGSENGALFIRQFNSSLVGINDAFVMVDDCPELGAFKNKPIHIKKTTASDSNQKVLCSDGTTYLSISYL